jgi:choline dehydrogenase
MAGSGNSRSINGTSPFAHLVDHELKPGPAAKTREAIGAAVIASVDVFHHATSTMPMGGPADTSAVVDELGALRGLEAITVVGASIFRHIPSGPINLSVIMAAEHVARLVYKRRQKRSVVSR